MSKINWQGKGKGYCFLGLSLIVWLVFLLLGWIDPVLVPCFYELPRFVRLSIYTVLGILFSNLLINGLGSLLQKGNVKEES